MMDKTFRSASFKDHLSAARVNLDVAELCYSQLVAGGADPDLYIQLVDALTTAGLSAAWASGRANDDLTALAALSDEPAPDGLPALLAIAAEDTDPEPADIDEVFDARCRDAATPEEDL